MCNAYNHPPDCRCGWGPRDSVGALGGVGFEWTHSLKSYESFVNTNARCPVCNQKVYFYRSPNNGRVYFDKLGPPWPKHPCMDTSESKKLETIPLTSNGIIMKCPPPDGEGWRPLLPNLLKRKFGTFYLLVEKQDFPGRWLALTLPLAGCCPIYWRRNSDMPENFVELSLLDVGKFGDIKIWQNCILVAHTYEEARKLKNKISDLFAAI